MTEKIMVLFNGKIRPKCYDSGCSNPADQDGYCRSHWNALFDQMTNHERMRAKKSLREARKAGKL